MRKMKNHNKAFLCALRVFCGIRDFKVYSAPPRLCGNIKISRQAALPSTAYVLELCGNS
jgi:hypothetical protein